MTCDQNKQNLKKDFRNYKKDIKKVIINFYEILYHGDILKIYSFLDTSFQREIPLNYFLIHSNYNVDFGLLKAIDEVIVDKEKNIAIAQITIVLREKEKKASISLKLDYGGWKIQGDIFRTFSNLRT